MESRKNIVTILLQKCHRIVLSVIYNVREWERDYRIWLLQIRGKMPTMQNVDCVAAGGFMVNKKFGFYICEMQANPGDSEGNYITLT